MSLVGVPGEMRQHDVGDQKLNSGIGSCRRQRAARRTQTARPMLAVRRWESAAMARGSTGQTLLDMIFGFIGGVRREVMANATNGGPECVWTTGCFLIGTGRT
jgi:hypothetical protein